MITLGYSCVIQSNLSRSGRSDTNFPAGRQDSTGSCGKPAEFTCDSNSRGTKAGRGRKEKVNHEDLKDLKGASAFASSASGEDFFEVFEVFVVRFSCQCLNRREFTQRLDILLNMYH